MNTKMIKMVLAVCLIAMLVLLSTPIRADAAGDSMSNATNVSFGKKYKGGISESDDEDWYKIELPSSGKLSIKLKADYCVNYTLYNKNCTDTLIGLFGYSDDDKNITLSINLVAGTYYFLVYGYYGDSGLVDYNITVSFGSSEESFIEYQTKRNDTRATANIIQFGTKYKGFLADVYDAADCYTFSLSKSDTVKLSAQAEVEQMYYELYNEDGKKIWSNYVDWSKTTKKSNYSKSWKLKKGEYYFVVNNEYCDGKNKKYSFKLTKASDRGWQTISGKKYYYVNGVKQKGWKKIGSNRYFFNQQGVMQTGWKRLDGEWYYFRKTGEAAGQMVTGFRKIDGNYYYFKKTGVRAKRFLKIDGRWYYFKKTGVMATNWLKIDGKWYYFGAKGSMAIGKKIKLGSKVYKFNSTGVCLNP